MKLHANLGGRVGMLAKPKMNSRFLLLSILVCFTLCLGSVHAEYGDVTFNKRAEKAGVRPVVFPHWFHRIRFRRKVGRS